MFLNPDQLDAFGNPDPEQFLARDGEWRKPGLPDNALRGIDGEVLNPLAAAAVRADSYLHFDVEGQPEPVTPTALAADLETPLVDLGFAKTAQIPQGSPEPIYTNLIRVPSDETIAELPIAADRAAKYLRFAGDGIDPILLTNTQVVADLDTALQTAGFTKGGGSAAEWSPMDFNAIGDGVTDDYAAVIAALESGERINGLGRTYGISAPIAPSVLTAFKNAKLVWLGNAAMTAQQFMLDIRELNNWELDDLWFDLGNIADTGQYDDSARGGLSVDALPANVLTNFNTQVAIRNCRCTGMGNGTAFKLRNMDRAIVSGLMVYQRRVAYAAGPNGNPPNDDMDGVDFTRCRNLVANNINVYDCQSLFDGSYVNYRGRGVLVTSTSDSCLSNIHANMVSQGFDFSGGPDLGGNRGLTLSNCSASDVHEWGFKFVHGIRDCQISNLIARRFGDGGFVLVSDTGAVGEARTGNLHFSNCHAFDPVAQPNEGIGNVPTTSKIGWRILWPTGGATTDLPYNCRFDNCTARDSTGGAMTYGFHSEAPAGYDTTNIFRNCEASGFTTAEYGGGINAAQWKKL